MSDAHESAYPWPPGMECDLNHVRCRHIRVLCTGASSKTSRVSTSFCIEYYQSIPWNPTPLPCINHGLLGVYRRTLTGRDVRSIFPLKTNPDQTPSVDPRILSSPKPEWLTKRGKFGDVAQHRHTKVRCIALIHYWWRGFLRHIPTPPIVSLHHILPFYFFFYFGRRPHS